MTTTRKPVRAVRAAALIGAIAAISLFTAACNPSHSASPAPAVASSFVAPSSTPASMPPVSAVTPPVSSTTSPAVTTKKTPTTRPPKKTPTKAAITQKTTPKHAAPTSKQSPSSAHTPDPTPVNPAPDTPTPVNPVPVNPDPYTPAPVNPTHAPAPAPVHHPSAPTHAPAPAPVHHPSAPTHAPAPAPVHHPSAPTHAPAPAPKPVHVPVVTHSSYTKTQSTPQPADQTVNDPNLPQGQTRVTQNGHPGRITITYSQTYVDGTKSGSPQETDRTTTSSAKPTITHVGTMDPPASTWQRDSSLASSTVSAINSWRSAHGYKRLNSATTGDCGGALKYAQSHGDSGGCGMDAFGYSSGSAAVNGWANDPSHRPVLADNVDFTAVSCSAFTLSGNRGASISCSFQ